MSATLSLFWIVSTVFQVCSAVLFDDLMLKIQIYNSSDFQVSHSMQGWVQGKESTEHWNYRSRILLRSFSFCFSRCAIFPGPWNTFSSSSQEKLFSFLPSHPRSHSQGTRRDIENKERQLWIYVLYHFLYGCGKRPKTVTELEGGIFLG